MAYIIYGIKNCNTMKKAFDWFKVHDISYEFHDYKKSGITKEKLEEWNNQIGWEKILNKKGMTWRRLPEEEREQINTAAKAIDLMMEKTSIIKRPLIEQDNKVVLLGFNEEEFEKQLIATK